VEDSSGILRLKHKHTCEESEVEHKQYAEWRTVPGMLRLKHKHTFEESQAEHTLYAEWRTYPGILRLITINVPFVFMARNVMILRQAISITYITPHRRSTIIKLWIVSKLI
jgi:hypothetical protein